jgi:hypothetical protein
MNKILNKFFLSIVCGALFLSTVLAVYAVQVGGAGNANGEVVGDLKLASAGALQTGVTAANTALLQAYDVDGAVYATFMTLTANNTPTADLASNVTSGGETILTSSFTGSGSVTTTGTITSGGLGTGAVIAKPTMTLGSDADGDMYYRASNVLTRLAKGTEGQVLTMNVGATAPEWKAATGGSSTKNLILKAFDDAGLVSTGDGKVRVTVPVEMNGMNITTVGLHCYTASTSGSPTVQIYNETDSADILSTRLTLDENEVDSSTAATAAVIDTDHDGVSTGDVLRIDWDTSGTGTKGGEVRMGLATP